MTTKLCYFNPTFFWILRVVLTGSLVVWNGDFLPFLFLWPWPWPSDLHIRTWPIFSGDTLDVRVWTPFIKAFESHHLTDVHAYMHMRTDRQTDRQTQTKLYTVLLRRWSTDLCVTVTIFVICSNQTRVTCASGWTRKQSVSLDISRLPDITSLLLTMFSCTRTFSQLSL